MQLLWPNQLLAGATLAPREGMQANIPTMGDKPSLTMADMGMDHGNMDMPMKGMDHSKMKMVDGKMDHSKMKIGQLKG